MSGRQSDRDVVGGTSVCPPGRIARVVVVGFTGMVLACWIACYTLTPGLSTAHRRGRLFAAMYRRLEMSTLWCGVLSMEAEEIPTRGYE